MCQFKSVDAESGLCKHHLAEREQKQREEVEKKRKLVEASGSASTTTATKKKKLCDFKEIDLLPVIAKLDDVFRKHQHELNAIDYSNLCVEADVVEVGVLKKYANQCLSIVNNWLMINSSNNSDNNNNDLVFVELCAGTGMLSSKFCDALSTSSTKKSFVLVDIQQFLKFSCYDAILKSNARDNVGTFCHR